MRQTRADLRAIKRADSAGGGVRIVNEGKVHADRFWAYALASRAADLPEQVIAYRSVPKPGFGENAGGTDLDDAFANRHGRRPQSAGRFGGGAW